MKFVVSYEYAESVGVYQIRNIVDPKIYIGSTIKSFTTRWASHLRELRKGIHHNIFLQRAFDKYGESAFVFEVVAVLPDRNEKVIRGIEAFFIDSLESHHKSVGYNLSRITTHPHRESYIMSDEQKAKIGEANRGRPSKFKGQRRPGVGSKISAAVKGVRKSEQGKKNMREAYARDHDRRLALLSNNWKGSVARGKSPEGQKRYKLACLSSSLKRRKVSDKQLLDFVRIVRENPGFRSETFADIVGVSHHNLNKAFRKIKGQYCDTFVPFLHRIGYIQAEGSGIKDLRDPIFQTKLDLNVDFQEGVENLITDCRELYNLLESLRYIP